MTTSVTLLVLILPLFFFAARQTLPIHLLVLHLSPVEGQLRHEAFLSVLFTAVSSEPRTVPGTQRVLSEYL